MRESCLYGSVGGTRFPTAMTIWPGHAAGAACPGRRMHISVRTLLPLATHVRTVLASRYAEAPRRRTGGRTGSREARRSRGACRRACGCDCPSRRAVNSRNR